MVLLALMVDVGLPVHQSGYFSSFCALVVVLLVLLVLLSPGVRQPGPGPRSLGLLRGSVASRRAVMACVDTNLGLRRGPGSCIRVALPLPLFDGVLGVEPLPLPLPLLADPLADKVGLSERCRRAFGMCLGVLCLDVLASEPDPLVWPLSVCMGVCAGERVGVECVGMCLGLCVGVAKLAPASESEPLVSPRSLTGLCSLLRGSRRGGGMK